MRPRDEPLWEFWSLAFWWAAWSLADAYLLPFTPFAELGTIGTCLFVAGVSRSYRRALATRRYAEQPDESGDAVPSKPAARIAIADAV